MSENKNLRTMEIRIKKGHRFYTYFDEICYNAKNLYNITNFYVRQVFTGLKKPADLRQPNEIEAIEAINNSIVNINQIKIDNVSKKRLKENQKPIEDRIDISDAKLYDFLDETNCYVEYNLIDGFFKSTNQVDYLNLPAHINQHVIKKVFQNWKSFFVSIKDYKINPSKYKGLPKPPRYAKKDGRKSVTFTNQICVIKDDKYLKFPKTKMCLNIGEIGKFDGILKEVRVSPYNGYFTVQLVFEISESKPLNKSPKNIIGIDLGVNNFATITNNIGIEPIIINGKPLKSINQYYNKKRAYYFGILRQGQDTKHGNFHSSRIDSLDMKRNDKIKDFMHKASHFVVDYSIENNIDTIVIGHNKDFKNNIEMRKDNKQNFTGIPFKQFINYVQYKANYKSIRVLITEESYTSKASFVDKDTMPVFGESDDKEYTFSGKRIKRGLYKTTSGKLLNADCNASGNIIRKVVPEAFNGKGDRGVVSTPRMLSIA